MNMNYPQHPIMDNRENFDWQKRLKGNKYLLIGGVIVVGLVVYLIIKFAWIRWVYIGLSFLSIVIFGVHKLLFKTQVAPTSLLESNRESELELEIESLKNRNDSLYQKVKELDGVISDKNTEMEQLRQQLEYARTECRLENKYSEVMRFLQKLNRYIDNEKIDRDFAVNIREYISNVLDTYGYKIVDYSPENSYAYVEEIDSVESSNVNKEEIDSVENLELVHRAIIDSKGNVVLKGKVYLSNNGQ